MFDRLQQTLHFIRTQNSFVPKYGIILGTGLGHLAREMDIKHSLLYEHIPHFPTATVETHKGKLLFGYLEEQPVVVMQGRFHYYEGYEMEQVTYGVRVMKLLGIEKLFISNAAGGLHPDFALSDLMVITDHINLQTSNPLRGKYDERLGSRFPDLLDIYSPELVSLAETCAKRQGISIHKGIYASVPGPNLETPAEYRFLSLIGADAVGMSTVPEVIVAAQMKLPVFAVSVITDLCSPGKIKHVTLKEILDAAADAEPKMTRLIRAMLHADNKS